MKGHIANAHPAVGQSSLKYGTPKPANASANGGASDNRHRRAAAFMLGRMQHEV
jgi:hypothetical protein